MREMKDCGFSWIGKIPSTWKLKKGKYLFVQRNQRGNSLNLELLSPTQKFGVIPQSLYEKLTTMRAVKLNENVDLALMKTIHVGDYCISLRSFEGGFEYSKFEGVVSPAYQVFYPIVDICDGYYKYLFKDRGFIEKMNSYTMTLRDGKNIAFDDFGNTYIPVPPIDEQNRISDYLDVKCVEIDTLSEEIQSEIDTLEEYKKSVITEAVTKGLNPKVEMKDSCIQWIGKIPSHWRSEKVKYHLHRNEPKNPGNVEVLSVYREYGVIPKNSRDDNHNITSEDTSKYKYVRKNVLVINKMKAWQGSMGVSDYEGIVSPAYFLYDIVSDAVYPQYLHFLFRTVYKDEFKRISGGIREGQWDLSPYEFENELFLIPPISEQRDIVNAIIIRCAEIDATINEKREQLATLAEYKKSLIYEYVTGKKEVPTEDSSTVVALEPRMMLLGTIIDKLGNNQKGRIQLQKIMYLVDMHLGLNYNIQYYRYDHGPYDIHLNDYIDNMVRNGWYQHRNQGGTLLVAGKNHADFLSTSKGMFADKETEIGNLLNLLQSMNVLKRTRMERIATLYAAWNDFLLEGITPTDGQIIQEVMTNWTENKGNTKYETWQDSLNKMKTNGLIPKGVGLHTLPKPQKEVAGNE